MNHSIACILCVAFGCVLVAVGISAVDYLPPLIAPLLSIAFGITTLISVVGVPCVLYQYLTNQWDDSWKLVAFSVLAWVVLATTQPNVEHAETWTVTGVVGEGSDPTEITGGERYHCKEDALVRAALIFEEREYWISEYRRSYDVDPNDNFDMDVRITHFSYIPALDWCNELFEADWGKVHYSLSFRHHENGDDPFGIIASQERPDFGEDDYEEYVPY